MLYPWHPPHPTNRMLALVALLAFQAQPARVDTTVVSRATCTECTLTLTPVRTISGVDVPLALGFQQVLRHPSGRYLLIDNGFRLGPTFADSNGRLSELTRSGDGPGEWRKPLYAYPIPGDSFAVYDLQTSRTTHYSWNGQNGPSWMTVQSHSAVSLGGDSVVFNGNSGLRETMGHSYFVYTPRRFSRVWNEVDPRLPLGAELSKVRALTRAGNYIWSAPQFYSATLEQRTVDGRLTRIINLQVPWYRSNSPVQRLVPSPTQPPRGRLLGLATKSDTLILALFEVPAPDYQRGMSYERAEGQRIYTVRSRTRALDGWLVVLDARSGQVLVMQQYDKPLGGLTNEGDVITLGGNAESTSITVSRLQILSSPTRR
jgi:hypothetical protein